MTLSSSSPEPLFFKAISDEYLIDCIGNILTEIAAENAKILDKKMSIFDSKTTPTISIKDYLKRLMKFSYCCQETLIVALIYLDRLFNQNPGVFPCDSNLHRFVLTSLILAIKFMEDKYYKNDYYAKVGGINVKELNKLEIEFLAMIEFHLFVDWDNFANFREKIIAKEK